MSVTLFELAGADPDLRFSPYCWRTRFALAHKGIACEGVAWRFTEKEALAASGQKLVPVMMDGDAVVADSWAIANYLDDTYPDRPALFPGGRAHARFINAWVDSSVHALIARLIVSDIYKILHPKDQAYFRQTREAALGRPLEEVTADRDSRVAEFRRALQPVRIMLRAQPWFGGESPDYADYILAGSLQWARCSSPFQLLDAEDAVAAWFGRVLALFDGLGARAVTV